MEDLKLCCGRFPRSVTAAEPGAALHLRGAAGDPSGCALRVCARGGSPRVGRAQYALPAQCPKSAAGERILRPLRVPIGQSVVPQDKSLGYVN
jgi:hypothetical protein